MVAAIPAIIAVAGTVASTVASRNTVEPSAGPDPADATAKAAEQQATIKASREEFIQRQGALGPIQLQAPTLKI